MKSGKFPLVSLDWLTLPLVLSERVAVTAEATSVAAASSVEEYSTVRVMAAPGAYDAESKLQLVKESATHSF